MVCVILKCKKRSATTTEQQVMNITAIAIKGIFHNYISITGCDSINRCSYYSILSSSLFISIGRRTIMRLSKKESKGTKDDEYNYCNQGNQFQTSLQQDIHSRDLFSDRWWQRGLLLLQNR